MMKTIREWNSVSTVTDPVLHVTQSTCKDRREVARDKTNDKWRDSEIACIFWHLLFYCMSAGFCKHFQAPGYPRLFSWVMSRTNNTQVTPIPGPLPILLQLLGHAPEKKWTRKIAWQCMALHLYSNKNANSSELRFQPAKKISQLGSSSLTKFQIARV